MALKDSQKDMHEHSAKKVELLRLYLDAYLSVLAHDKYTEAICCYDLFCGEGVYPNGGKGSPIVFYDCLSAFALNHREKRFFFHFNDQDDKKVDNVQSHISRLEPRPGNLAVTCSTLPFDEVIRETKGKLGSMGKEKAFLFVDPYGYKEIKPQLIKELLQGRKSEVLLFLPTQQMFRFSKKGTPEALSEFLEGIHQGRMLPAAGSITDYIEYIVDGFRLLMPDNFVDSFTIRKDPHTAFCLFFFTSNLKGAEKMIEAKWKLDEHQGEGWSYKDSGYDRSLFEEPQINPLEKLLEGMLKKGPQTNSAIYEATVRAGFLPKHAKQILSAMQEHGRIKVQPDSVRRGTFYLTYQATQSTDLAKRENITIVLS